MIGRTVTLAAAMVVFVGLVAGPAAKATDGVSVTQGQHNGVSFRVAVPATWNGTLLLWSRAPIYEPDEIQLASDPFTERWLLEHGYALAASNYRTRAELALAEPMQDQLDLLDWIDRNIGSPRRTIAWGNSGGGLLSVLLVEANPDRFAGAAPLCGVLAGIGGLMNRVLDFSFAVKTLLAPSEDLQLVNITDPQGTAAKATQVLLAALETPAGRARLALANALASVPGWARALQPRPSDVAGQVAEQALYDVLGLVQFWTETRQQTEQLAGGNPSWNDGVDYRRQLAHSSQRELVQEAYRQADLDLHADLAQLADAHRIRADTDAVDRLARFTPSGRIQRPVVTLHATGDGLAVPEGERQYGEQVGRHGDAGLLQQLFVERGGHCSFTASEVIVALKALLARIDTGRWPTTGSVALNAAARALGPGFQVASDWGVSFQFLPTAPAFVTYEPARYLRPFPSIYGEALWRARESPPSRSRS